MKDLRAFGEKTPLTRQSLDVAMPLLPEYNNKVYG
jgi:hypothetical protein